jgi:hypothetical protein
MTVELASGQENMTTPVTVKCTERVGPPTAEHACKQGPSLPTGCDLEQAGILALWRPPSPRYVRSTAPMQPTTNR